MVGCDKFQCLGIGLKVGCQFSETDKLNGKWALFKAWIVFVIMDMLSLLRAWRVICVVTSYIWVVNSDLSQTHNLTRYDDLI